MLEGYRQIVGDAAFWDFQRALIDQFSGSTITTDAFIALAKQIAQQKAGFEASNLGKLDTYFTQWLKTPGKPTMTPTTFFASSTVPGDVSGTVPATLALTLGGTPTFGAFIAGRGARSTRRRPPPTSSRPPATRRSASPTRAS